MLPAWYSLPTITWPRGIHVGPPCAKLLHAPFQLCRSPPLLELACIKPIPPACILPLMLLLDCRPLVVRCGVQVGV